MDPTRPTTVQPGYSRVCLFDSQAFKLTLKAALTGTNGAGATPTAKKPVVKLSEAEVEAAQAKIASHVDLPLTEKVKEGTCRRSLPSLNFSRSLWNERLP